VKTKELSETEKSEEEAGGPDETSTSRYENCMKDDICHYLISFLN
jgi:hypothetical protein